MPIKPAFSAVELLLVAGISAILVVIAMPGYMDAKIRAEVADAKLSVREVNNAIIQYKIDFNQFPEAPQYGMPNPLHRLVKNQYLSYTPNDRFKEGLEGIGGYYADTSIGFDYMYSKNPAYQLTLKRRNSRIASTSNGFTSENANTTWYVKSIGPDRTDFHDEGFGRGSNTPNLLDLVEWDPTNGLISLGEIVRFFP